LINKVVTIEQTVYKLSEWPIYTRRAGQDRYMTKTRKAVAVCK